MGYLEGFKYKIFRLQELKESDEFLLYHTERKHYHQFNYKRLIEILIKKLSKEIKLLEFCQDFTNKGYDVIKKRAIDPKILIFETIVNEEYELIDNLNYKPNDELIFEEDGKFYFNTYKKSKLLSENMKDRDIKFPLIKKLIDNLVSNNEKESEYLIKWIAWQIQNPLKRLPTSIILQGEPGTGKTKFCELVLKPIFENNFCEIGQSDINKEYNDYILGKQLIVANEVIHNDNKYLVPDKLKNYVTDEYLSINRKFKDTIYVRNYSQWIFVTNNQIPLKIERGDRRYSVFQSKKLLNGRNLIKSLIEKHDIEIRNFIHYLKTLEVNYDEIDSPIENEAKEDLIKASYNSVQEFYHYIIDDLGGIDKISENFNVDINILNKLDKNFIITNDLFKVYCLYCQDVGYSPSSKTHFTRTLKQFNLRSETQRIEGKTQRVLVIQ